MLTFFLQNPKMILSKTQILENVFDLQILRLTIRKIFIYRKAVTPHVYTNIKNVLSFREARNLGVKILTARHSDSE